MTVLTMHAPRGCGCALTPEQVRTLNPAIEIPAFPAFTPRIPLSVFDAPRSPRGVS